MSSSSRRLAEGSVVILFDAGGRVLLQQRDDDTPPAGYGRWAIPGGGRESGETPRETALREFEEETGVRLERLRFFASYAPGEVPHRPHRHLHVFFADDEVDEAAVTVNEGLAFRYWAPAEVAGLAMNPGTRGILDTFLASDKYHGAVALKRPNNNAAGIIALDRWGRLLLQLRDADLPTDRYPDHWSLPGGVIEPGESPDRAAIREFEEETGALVEDLRLFAAFQRGTDDLPGPRTDTFHLYYCDPDLALEELQVNEGQALAYFRPDELSGLAMPPSVRTMVERFLASTHYRAMFH